MVMWRNDRIIVTKSDLERLRAILNSPVESARDFERLRGLRDELDRAQVVPEEEMPSDVVTLRSQVRVRDRKTGMASNYTLVTPAHADVSSAHVSVLAPLGTALLGYREGDEVEWQMLGGVRRLWIERVRQPQPMSADRSEHVTSVQSAHAPA
jgi:regulator of nucleoside diphosphate kinase